MCEPLFDLTWTLELFNISLVFFLWNIQRVNRHAALTVVDNRHAALTVVDNRYAALTVV
jgi:hypothetical protein